MAMRRAIPLAAALHGHVALNLLELGLAGPRRHGGIKWMLIGLRADLDVWLDRIAGKGASAEAEG